MFVVVVVFLFVCCCFFLGGGCCFVLFFTVYDCQLFRGEVTDVSYICLCVK